MKKRYIYLLSFFLPLLTLFVGMVYFGVAPFGDNSLLIIDGLHQYMPFFSVLYDKLKGGESLFYSFRTGLGINFLSLFAYYLSSPLNLLILLFSREDLNMVVSWLIVLKLALSSLFASVYFTHRSKKPGLHIVAVSLAFALNGYMVGYCWNVMWLDAIMVLPLILLGIEKLIDEKDGRLYGITLFYALYCNYYIAFMICIFSVIWYLFHHFTSIKQFFCRGIVFTIYSFVAAGMSAILLIPAYLGIKSTASGSEMELPLHSWLTGFWDLIARQFDMAYPISHDNFDGNANLYFGIFAIFFLVIYLSHRKICLIDKGKKLLLIVFFYLSFNEEILNFIWHGFHDQYGIPNRFSFLYGFVLLTMVFEVFEEMDSIRIWEPILSLLACGGLLAGVCYFTEDALPLEVICSAAFLLLAYTAILFLLKKDRKRLAFYHFLLPTLIAGEMMVTALLGFDTNGQISISKFFYATEDMEEAIEEHEDGTFYRSELAKANIVDESTWYPMHAVTLFGSTARDGVVDLMDSLGFATGCNEYLYKGANPVTNLMFDVKYLYYHADDSLKTDFEYVDSYGSISLYENQTEGMSIAYGISPDIDNWYYSSDYPFRVINDFTYQGYFIDNIFEDVAIPDPITHDCEVSSTNDGEYYFELGQKQEDNLIFTLPFPDGSDDFYLFYDGTQIEKVEIKIDDTTVESGDFDGMMLPLGRIEAGSVLTITVSLKGEQTSGYVRFSAADFNQEMYQRLVNEMTSQSLNVTSMSDVHIEGDFDAIEDEYLFFSIPYDEGWTVKIDGKNAETFAVGEALLSVIIPEGEHTVTLDYIPSGFLLGRKITLISVLLFALLCIFTHIRKRKEKKEAYLKENILHEEEEDDLTDMESNPDRIESEGPNMESNPDRMESEGWNMEINPDRMESEGSNMEINPDRIESDLSNVKSKI